MAFKSHQARRQVKTVVGHKPVTVYLLIYVQKLKSAKPGGCTFLFLFSRSSQLGRATYQLGTCCAPSWKSVLKFCCSVPNCTVSIFRVQHVMLIVCTSRTLLRCGFERQFSQLCTVGGQSSGGGSRALKATCTEEAMKLGRAITNY